MSGKHPAAFVVTITAVAALLALAVAACGTTGAGGAGSAIATSSAVEKAKTQLDTCFKETGASALLSSAGRSKFTQCMGTLVSPANREQFKNCITTAVTSDKLWTSEGRAKFTDQSLPHCIDAAA